MAENNSSVAEAVTFENLYFALLGAAEDFRTARNPDIRKSIHCLEAILICNPPSRIEVRSFPFSTDNPVVFCFLKCTLYKHVYILYKHVYSAGPDTVPDRTSYVDTHQEH